VSTAGAIRRVEYKETAHAPITREFLQNRERFT
jgi:predicted ATPase